MTENELSKVICGKRPSWWKGTAKARRRKGNAGLVCWNLEADCWWPRMNWARWSAESVLRGGREPQRRKGA